MAQTAIHLSGRRFGHHVFGEGNRLDEKDHPDSYGEALRVHRVDFPHRAHGIQRNQCALRIDLWRPFSERVPWWRFVLQNEPARSQSRSLPQPVQAVSVAPAPRIRNMPVCRVAMIIISAAGRTLGLSDPPEPLRSGGRGPELRISGLSLETVLFPGRRDGEFDYIGDTIQPEALCAPGKLIGRRANPFIANLLWQTPIARPSEVDSAIARQHAEGLRFRLFLCASLNREFPQ